MQIAAQAQTLLLLNVCCGNMLQQHLLKCNLIVTQGRALQRGAYVIYTTNYYTYRAYLCHDCTSIRCDSIRFDWNCLRSAYEIFNKAPKTLKKPRLICVTQQQLKQEQSKRNEGERAKGTTLIKGKIACMTRRVFTSFVSVSQLKVASTRTHTATLPHTHSHTHA